MPNNEDSLFSSLSELSLESLLTPAETQRVSGKLWELLARRAESYTMGGSSSIRAELAQELLKAALFVLRHGIGAGLLPEAVRARLLRDDFDDLFRAGLTVLEEQVEAGRMLYEKAVRTSIETDNLAYQNTKEELGVFFKRYHIHHFAHEIPCLLDYPLAQAVDEALLGIDYVSDYLRRLILENSFVGRFDSRLVTALLKSVSPVYRDDLLNIYEAVAANALALTLLGGDIQGLDVTGADRRKLAALVGDLPDGLLSVKLRAASEGLLSVLGLGGGEDLEYLLRTASALFARVASVLPTGRLERIFPSLCREPIRKKPDAAYIDNPAMTDENLRALIDVMTSCRHISDKITLVRRYVASLRDLTELLDVCFWGEEQDALFGELSPEVCLQLRRFADNRRDKYPEWQSETGWEDRLEKYTENQG